MGGGQEATTQQVSQVQLPQWVQDAAQSNYGFAKQVANRPLTQFAGPTVADPSTMTTEAYQQLQQLAQGQPDVGTIPNISATGILDASNPYYQQAKQLYGSSAGPLDINSYYDPYTQDVTNRAITNANISLDQQLAQLQGSEKTAGAFGGSRGAIGEAVTRAQGVKNIGDLTAQLNDQAYQQALTAAQNEKARQAGAAAGLTTTGGAAGGAVSAQQAALQSQQQQQAAIAQMKQQYGLTDAQALLSAGGQEQQQRQSVIDAAIAKFNEARDYPVQQLNTLLAALGMTPYGKTETTNKVSDVSNSPDFLTAGLGAAKMLFPGGLGAGGGTLLGALGLLSDRKDKTDITKLGKDESGLEIYAYRYKDDPKDYPKIVGPMAQDVEKRYPKAVKKIGGHKVIDIHNLLEALG